MNTKKFKGPLIGLIALVSALGFLEMEGNNHEAYSAENYATQHSEIVWVK